MVRVLWAVCLFLAGSMALADELPLLTRVRDAVRDNNIPAVEALIADAHALSLQTGDTTPIYIAYRRIFGNTNPARADFIAAWIEAYPRSAYAHAAEAERLYMTAFAYQIFPGQVLDDPQAVAHQNEHFAGARLAALRAQRLDPRFSRATDLAIFMAEGAMMSDRIVELARPTLESAPNRRTVVFLAKAVTFSARDGVQALWDACTTFAPVVPGLTTDSCLIQAIFDGNSVGDLTDAATRALDKTDDPELAHARVQSIIYHDRADRYSPDAAFALHRSRLPITPDLEEWLQDGQTLGIIYPGSFYAAEVFAEGERELRARLADDPDNAKYIRLLLLLPRRDPAYDGTVVRASTPEERQLYLKGLKFGQFSADYWQLGAVLAYDDKDRTAAALPYYQNAAFTGRHAPRRIALIVNYLSDIAEAISGREPRTGFPTRLDDPAFVPLQCELVRASRVLIATCQDNAGRRPAECEQSYQPFMLAEKVSKEAAAGGLCPALRDAPLRDLAYSSLQAVPGFDPTAAGRE